jgi:arsenite transporter
MSVFERYLTLWVALCIVVGLAAGHLFPGLFQFVGGSSSPGSTCPSRC